MRAKRAARELEAKADHGRPARDLVPKTTSAGRPARNLVPKTAESVLPARNLGPKTTENVRPARNLVPKTTENGPSQPTTTETVAPLEP